MELKNVMILLIKKCNDFAKTISDQFKTAYHNEWKIKGPLKRENFLVINSELKIIFDSSSIDKKLKDEGKVNQMKIDLDIIN